MSDKRELREKLLAMLRDDMKGEMKNSRLHSMDDLEMPEGKMKATIIADDKEGLLEGAKKLPEAMSKADAFMEARSKDKKKKRD